MTEVRRARAEAAARWFVLLGGMTAFALHLLAAFYLVPFSCLLDVRWPLYAVTAAFGAMAAAAVIMGWRRLGSASGAVEAREWAPGRGSRTDRARFMIGAGVFLSLLGLLIIVYAGTAIAVFDPCVNWRI